MRLASVIAAVVAAGPFASAARAAAVPPPPQIARPNPAVYAIRVDYISPLRTPTGEIASLPPLAPAATAAAIADQRFLAFQLRDDLGGFVPAPVGQVLASGGRAVVGATGSPELPLFAQAAGGSVNSFTFTSGPLGPPENGKQPVPGVGVPPVVAPPTNSNTVPPPNQGFGGRPPSPPPTTTPTTTQSTPTTTTPKPPPPPPTTTTQTTTTATTTTATTATTTGPTPPPPSSGSSGSCGTAGIAIESNLTGCRIDARNMRPGDSTAELVTVTNTSGSRYTLSVRAAGSPNRLWDDLRLGIWEHGTAAPSPLPPLLDWTTQFNVLTTLAPGQSVTYEIEVFLPASAGNADQNLAAVISFIWHASG